MDFQSTGKECNMEMCYDGALVMPNNYAVVNEEEMMYVDGGFGIPNGLIGGAINLAIAAIFASIGGGLGGCAAKNLAAAVKAAGRGAVEAEIKKFVNRCCTLTIASWVCGWVPSMMTLFGYIIDPGRSIADWLDSKDGCPNNGYLDI